MNQNEYIQKEIPALYRKQILDVMIYTYIRAQKILIPTLTIQDCSMSFLKQFGINEDHLSVHKVEKTFYRIQKELLYEGKQTS